MTEPNKIWIDEFMKLNWEGTIVTSPFLSDEIVEKVDMFLAWGDRSPLEGFEKVLGRKFTCYDCREIKNYSPYSNCCKYFSFNRFNLHGLKPCKHLKLSKDVTDIIRFRDWEIEETKIDTHPRFLLSHPYLKNSSICSVCDEETNKKGVRLEVEKKWNWFHTKCFRANQRYIDYSDELELIF